MSIEEIHQTTAAQLAEYRVPRWFQYEPAARKDVLYSAQIAADATGDPQFLVNARTMVCTEMVISDTRRALAAHPGRFARHFAAEAAAEYERLQALAARGADGAGGGT